MLYSFYLSFFSLFYVCNQTVMWSAVRPPVTTVIQNGRASNSSRAVRSTTSCILPANPNHGSYDVLNVNNSQPGQAYDTLVLSVSCDQGYGVYNPNTYILCIQGVWYEKIPKCVRFCKLDADPSVDYRCLTPGVGFVKSCHGYLAPGTTVSPECKSPDYYSDNEIMLDMECTQGRWNYIAKCKPVCGRVVDKNGTGLLIGGTYTRHGMVPWHVGLYKKTENYAQICGGSVVTSKVVLSAAHCFASINPSDYAVAAGKIYRTWNSQGDVNGQKSDVKELVIPRLYQGAIGRFGLDIAALILATPFHLNPFVRPVCLSFVDYFDKWQLRHGNLGKVAGWGLTAATGPASDILKVVDFPVISEDACLNTIPQHFRPYITGDKFCAGYTNGTALCQGDSGGGLAIPDKELGEDRFYLRGIVSTAPRSDDASLCNDHTYTAFTKVAKFQDFIKNAIAASERKTCQDANCDDDCADGSSECKSVITSEPEADPCEWNEIKGKCVPAKVCLTSLSHIDDKHPPCVDKDGNLNNICCTDCTLVNDTSNFILSADGGIFWKDGRKARDACLQYLKDVPHICHHEGYYYGISRSLNKEKKCHDFETYGIGATNSEYKPPSENPYEALVGVGKDLEKVHWTTAGAIISEKFILTSAHDFFATLAEQFMYYAAMGMKNRKSDKKDWQIHTVKTIYRHPEYMQQWKSRFTKHNDIALLELETSITFNDDILPACLPIDTEEFDIETAKFSSWKEKDTRLDEFLDAPYIIRVKKRTVEECDVKIREEDIPSLTLHSTNWPEEVNSELQLCYGDNNTCLNIDGGPLVVTTQFSRCMNTVIGVNPFGYNCAPTLFTKVQYFVPWIESIVWP